MISKLIILSLKSQIIWNNVKNVINIVTYLYYFC